MNQYLRCGNCKRISKAEPIVSMATYKCHHCEQTNEVTNISLQEWLDFNYKTYLELIKKFIEKDSFTDLLGVTEEEIMRGKLSPQQIEKLKEVLKTSFDKGKTIKEIRNQITKKVQPKELQVTNEEGEVTRTVSPERRALSIARTETTRTANEGTRDHYKQSGVQEYRWVAALSQRTCPECEKLNGQIFRVNSQTIPPAHSLCRCTIIPITELD